jgi:hypothetical protein
MSKQIGVFSVRHVDVLVQRVGFLVQHVGFLVRHVGFLVQHAAQLLPLATILNSRSDHKIVPTLPFPCRYSLPKFPDKNPMVRTTASHDYLVLGVDISEKNLDANLGESWHQKGQK